MDCEESDDPAACWEENAETWTRQTRAGYDVYRDALNSPAFLALLPPVDGLEGLDVGCGEGTNTRRVAALGARMRGLDIAPTFIRHARETERADPMGVAYDEGDASALPFAGASFDFVTAFMSLMDVPDPALALREIRRVLRPGGFVQFSILHPCFAPPKRRVLRDAAGEAYAVELADYFKVGRHAETWHFLRLDAAERRAVKPFRVPYTHMTLVGWFDAVRCAGLIVEALGEPMASEETAAATPEVADTRVVPLFLHVRARTAALSGFE